MKLNCILLVDDDKICNYLHERVIKQLNIANEIKIAFNGIEAFDQVNNYVAKQQKLPELILLDLKMPVMDGFEFLELFKEKNFNAISRTLILVLTTSTHPQDLERVSEMKNVIISSKPLTQEKLDFIYKVYFETLETSVNL